MDPRTQILRPLQRHALSSSIYWEVSPYAV